MMMIHSHSVKCASAGNCCDQQAKHRIILRMWKSV